MYHKGFTLLEILIVLAIIAIMSSVITLNIGASSYLTFMSKAKKIAVTLSVLNEEAIYTDSVIDCTINEANLECEKYKNGQWVDLNLNQIISWKWPNNIKVQSLVINGITVNNTNNIKFLPNDYGDQTSIQITDGEYYTWVDGDIHNNFQVNN